jgi:hypothetical protein
MSRLRFATRKGLEFMIPVAAIGLVCVGGLALNRNDTTLQEGWQSFLLHLAIATFWRIPLAIAIGLVIGFTFGFVGGWPNYRPAQS